MNTEEKAQVVIDLILEALELHGDGSINVLTSSGEHGHITFVHDGVFVRFIPDFIEETELTEDELENY